MFLSSSSPEAERRMEILQTVRELKLRKEDTRKDFFRIKSFFLKKYRISN